MTSSNFFPVTDEGFRPTENSIDVLVHEGKVYFFDSLNQAATCRTVINTYMYREEA